MQRYYIVIDYIPHIVHFLPVTHLFCNGKFVPINLSHLFFSSPHTPGNHLLVFCIYNSGETLIWIRHLVGA